MPRVPLRLRGRHATLYTMQMRRVRGLQRGVLHKIRVPLLDCSWGGAAFPPLCALPICIAHVRICLIWGPCGNTRPPARVPLSLVPYFHVAVGGSRATPLRDAIARTTKLLQTLVISLELPRADRRAPAPQRHRSFS